MATSLSTIGSTWSRTYTGKNLLQIAMPMGGIGAGCVCLNGIGGLQDFSIKGKPSTTALPDGWDPVESAFALIHIKGDRPVTRLIEGPYHAVHIYNQSLHAQGSRKGGFEGLPRFAKASFTNRYPFGTVSLSDSKLPIEVELEGWSPFIPLDDINSGIPCAVLNYTFRNVSDQPVEFDFSYQTSHFAVGEGGGKGTRNSLIGSRGIHFTNTDNPAGPKFGSSALAIASSPLSIKAMWFRGGWFDSITALWREVSEGTFSPNDGSFSARGMDGMNGGAILVPGSLAPGESITMPVVIAWHFPNNPISVGLVGDEVDAIWHPFYTNQWSNAAEVANYVLDNLGELYRRTAAFRDTLYSTTAPSSLIEAVGSNLAILKSPTVMRQRNGNIWCWEGCFTDRGCCHGSCTHVWNYAQAIPHLYPALERTLREQEYGFSMDERGHINFRSALPNGPTNHDFHAAADGQMGGVMKVYREWQIGGDRDWLERIYPLVKLSLDYGIQAWDPGHRGALIEPHHNTYDIEFWGPDGMCTTIYAGALSAMAEMANSLGKAEDHRYYAELAARSGHYLDKELFNGEYFYQRVQWDGLKDRSFKEMIDSLPANGLDEMSALLKAEGPKYQYGTGCISDGVIGAWMAKIYGIETSMDADNLRSHLAAIHRHNFKGDLTEHACLQRPGYALGAESGLLLCTWPRGDKPTLPFVYSDEVWTGIEYQVASHMIAEGLVPEGLEIVEAARSRYNGHVRNPFNEYECGSYYARALASYALLGAYSGFRYSAVTKTLWFGPRADLDEFVTFFSCASGFGIIRMSPESLTITMTEGEMPVDTLVLTRNGVETKQPVGAVAQVGSPVTI